MMIELYHIIVSCEAIGSCEYAVVVGIHEIGHRFAVRKGCAGGVDRASHVPVGGRDRECIRRAS